MRVVCGIKVEWRGTEKIPKGACIVACKHQSAWETFALYAVLDDPVYVLKRELMWIPLFGWYQWKAGSIPIDRTAGMAALARMTARAQKTLAGAAARQLVIFPEGTRRPPGAAPDYKPGIVYLYGKPASPACRWRSIRDCFGRADRCACPPAPSSSKFWIRSRPASTRTRSLPGCATRSKQASNRLLPEIGSRESGN